MKRMQIKMAIQMNQVANLTRIPGIGKKTAERIIVELSDRIHKWKETSEIKVVGEPDLLFDALSALINLGYNQASSQKALQKAIEHSPEGNELPKLITLALRHL